MELSKFVDLGLSMGYEGVDLQNFVKEQQNRERDERCAERDFQREREERQHQLELEKVRQRDVSTRTDSGSRAPKLPAFSDGKDELDSYLQRFERFARNADWDRTTWATKLAALLTGKALEVYSRMADEQAEDYDRVKEEILRRYDFTEDGYRDRFRTAKPEEDETPDQFIVRLECYLDKWIELSKTENDALAIKKLFVKEQFIYAVPKDVAIHLQERAPGNLEELAQMANNYLRAHDRQLVPVKKSRYVEGRLSSNSMANKENKNLVRCYSCDEYGHKAYECRKKTQKKEESKSQPVKKTPKSANAIQVSTIEEIQECVLDDHLLLSNGRKVPVINNAGVKAMSLDVDNMPVQEGKINDYGVSVLRDSGCNGVVVKKDFVKEDQYTGDFGYMILIDKTVRKVPLAKIDISCPWYTGEVTASCLPDAMYDLIVGNIEGVRAADDPDLDWMKSCAVTTRAETKEEGKVKPLKVSQVLKPFDISKEEFVNLQKNDETLKKLWDKKGTINKKEDKEVEYKSVGGILHRMFKHAGITKGKTIKQVIIPLTLRTVVMDMAHNSIMGGHMGVQKTLHKVLGNFYWPGVNGDVARYCRSCDVCQKTVNKGRTGKAPMQKMPLIDQPFKRVAIDLIGPIHPPSESGHKYILTLVDYATRYPEAVPLKHAKTEDVAEALVDMFSRLGVPEEVLSDNGTQFVSDCMKEVARLLSLKQLRTTPYHPMCNGLVEKFNGTLKTMLRRLSCEQPRQWHRYINALLFAYREVPQESTGFAPFELLYGRTVRGPMQILQEVWTKEDTPEEVKISYQYVFELRERIEETLEIARGELQKAQSRQKHYYDRKAKRKELKVGDQVLVLLPTDKNKLLMQWKGPYPVEEKVGICDYRVNVNGRLKMYHSNLLKEYVARQELSPQHEHQELETSAGFAVVEFEESTPDDAINNEDLLELGCSTAKESVKDLVFGDNLKQEQVATIKKIVQSYSDIFTDQPGLCNLVKHSVILTSEEPVRSKPYSVPYATRQELKDELKKMQELGVIRESTSPYASPVVIVGKKDGSKRICIDYRKLNKLTVPDPEPITSAADVFQRVATDKYFTKIDLSKGYWQVPVNEEDISKTAFVTHDGSYEFLRMPFGMMNSGATLVRGIRKLLMGMNYVDSYIDDILVHTENWEDHIETLKELFKRLKASGLTVRPSKCVIGAEEVQFLGHHLGEGVLGMDGDNVEKIKKAPRPKTKKDLRSFLGLIGYYRDFVPNFAAVAVPLTDLTRKGTPNTINWDEAQENAYTTLKNVLCQGPILRLPDHKKPYVVRTDASDYGLGAVLLQEHDGQLYPVCYASKKLSDRERRYHIMEKECMAIVFAVKKFVNYIYGTEFVLQTDHQPLQYLDKSKFESNRIMRWAMYLQSFRIKIEAIKGKDNVGADYLSRIV